MYPFNKILTTPTLLYILLFASCNSTQQQKENSVNTNKLLIENYYKLFNNHNWKQMAQMYVEFPIMKDPSYGTKAIKSTRLEIEKKYTELVKTIPDLHDEIISIYESGNTIIVEFESTGTLPDSSKFLLPICTIFEITNGKISKDLTYYDNFDEPKN